MRIFGVMLFCLVIVLSGCAQESAVPSSEENESSVLEPATSQANFTYNWTTISIENTTVNARVADTFRKQMKGLMFTPSMPYDEGMFFIFDEPSIQAFWMKNTLIPLDMIFIDENLFVVNCLSAVPCRQQSCPIYKSTGPARYVLEVNEGFCEEFNINNKTMIELSQ